MMSTINPSTDVTLHPLPDYIKENLDMVVVGLNPSLTSAQIGHYFAGPGNHFWSCVSEVGLVSEPVTCYDDSRMIDHGIGFTNACSRATKGAADLTKKEMKDGMKSLLAKLQKYSPKIVVFNGKGTYEIFVRHKHFGMGKQPQRLEGTNSVVFVMPSSSARCAQLPRAADKIPFFSALKDLRDRIKVWSNGLSTGDRLVPLEDTVNTSMFPDQIDLELTRLYDAGKSNYSTDRAEKKRKANASNGMSPMNLKTSSSEDSSQGSAPGINVGQQLSKPNNFSRQKDERLSSQSGPNYFMTNQSPAAGNGQWVTGAFYNSSFSYQQYLLESSSSQYPSQSFCRYPSFRSNILPNGLPSTGVKNYSNSSSTHHPFTNADEKVDNPYDHTSSNEHGPDDLRFSHESCNKPENINNKNDAKEIFVAEPASTNFVSLLMSDSLSVPGSPSEVDKSTDGRFSQSSIAWSNDSCPFPYPLQASQNNPFWEQNNNHIVNPYFAPSRRPMVQQQQHPIASMFTSFQSNMGNFEEMPTESQYQSPFTASVFFSSPTSMVGSACNHQISSIHSPLSSDQVTSSSLCSVKVAPDSTSLANQKRSFSGPDMATVPQKIMATDDLFNHCSDHVSLTYTDL